MNSNSFIDLCHGHSGRKVVYTSADGITKENTVDVVGRAVSVPNYNRPAIRYLYDYYKDDQPIHYRGKKVWPDINNKTCENYALETVHFNTSQTYGEPIQYVSRKTDKEINDAVGKLNDYMKDAHRQARNIKLGNFQSAAETAYKITFKGKPADIAPFRIRIPNPLNTIVVYSTKDDSDMLSIQVLKDERDEQRYQCCSDDLYFIVKVGRVTDFGISGFGGTLIVEYLNDPDRLSDIEIVITLLDQINKVQPDRMNGIEQFIQALMLFKSCEIDEKKFLQVCDLGAVEVKNSGQGMQSDIKLMTAELNRQQIQVAKDDVYRQVLVAGGMPDQQQNTDGNTGQAVYLRNGWDFVEQRAKLNEPFTIEAEKKYARIVLNIIKQIINDIPLTVGDFDVKITQNSADNMLVKAQALDYLLRDKIHPLIAITVCGLFGDPERVWTQSKSYIDAISKTQEQLDTKAEREHALEFSKIGQAETVKTGGVEQAFLFLYQNGAIR